MTQAQPAFRRDPHAKRERLLDAAEHLFSTRGFDATTSAQIARVAGVSEGILFHHFGTKQGLFHALARRYVEQATAATVTGDDLTEERVVRNAFDFADAHPALYQMLDKGAGDLSRQEVDAQAALLVQAIAARLRQAMAAGQIRTGDADIMASLQFAVVEGAIKAWHADGDRERRESYITEAISCMKAMLAPEES